MLRGETWSVPFSKKEPRDDTENYVTSFMVRNCSRGVRRLEDGRKPAAAAVSACLIIMKTERDYVKYLGRRRL